LVKEIKEYIESLILDKKITNNQTELMFNDLKKMSLKAEQFASSSCEDAAKKQLKNEIIALAESILLRMAFPFSPSDEKEKIDNIYDLELTLENNLLKEEEKSLQIDKDYEIFEAAVSNESAIKKEKISSDD
jgi:hypothetical protein